MNYYRLLIYILYNSLLLTLILLKLDQKGEHMDWFLDLEEEQEFVKKFILASGSLKLLAKDYEESING